MTLFELPGIVCAAFEILFYIVIARKIRKFSTNLTQMNTFTYYWFTFTVLTGLWEISYITNYDHDNSISRDLLKTNTHAWTNKYSIQSILPWRFSEIFYGEYGAYADREYMSEKDSWSHFIEGSHCIWCGGYCLLALIMSLTKGITSEHYTVAMAFAMGNQFMNSILYLSEYTIQINDPNNVNYNTVEFPTGILLSKRAFMWVNILWIINPAIIIYKHLYSKTKNENNILCSDSKLSEVCHSSKVSTVVRS